MDITEGQIIWIKSPTEGWVEALVIAHEEKFLPESEKQDFLGKTKRFLTVKFMEGIHYNEILTLPLSLVTISLEAPASIPISGGIERCNSEYSLKELQDIARDNKVSFSGLTKLELCKKLVNLGVVK